MSSRIGSLVLGFALLLGAGPARAGSLAPPHVEWSFYSYASDGSGGFGNPGLIFEHADDSGGSVEEGVVLEPGSDPQARILFSSGAEDFWASVRAPHPAIVTQGTLVGGRAEISVSRVYRKDASNATMSFAIPQSQLSLLGADVPGADDLSAIVVHSFLAGGFFAFFEEARLTGNVNDYTFSNGSGLLPYEITSGGLDQAGVTVELSQPYVQDVDLSSLLVGDEFTVTYHIIADAVDPVQGEATHAIAAALDPDDESDGVTIETEGLTELPVPGASAALLLATGGAVLIALRRPTRSAAVR